MAERRRVRVVVSGRVQGVAFRDATRQTAEALGLGGWVRNLEDGRVEAVFEGDAGAVEKALAWCRKGPPAARVSGLEVLPASAEPAAGAGPESGFRIRPTAVAG